MATTTKSEELIAHLAATTMVARLGSGDVLELPEKIKRSAGLSDGDTIYVEAIDQRDDVIRVHPRKIDPDQLWGWTPESQAAIRESEENYTARRSTFYASDGICPRTLPVGLTFWAESSPAQKVRLGLSQGACTERTISTLQRPKALRHDPSESSLTTWQASGKVRAPARSIDVLVAVD